MSFFSVVAGIPYSYFGTQTDLYWVPPGMEYGGSRLATGYLVDAPAPVGVAGGHWSSGVRRLAFNDSPVNSLDPVNTVTTSYSAFRGPLFFAFLPTFGDTLVDTDFSQRFTNRINRQFRYGPRTRHFNEIQNTSYACALDGDITRYDISKWPGSLGSLTTQTNIFSSPDFMSFSTTGDASHPVTGLVVLVETDIASSTKTFFSVSWGGESPGKVTEMDVVYGSRGSALARIRANSPSAGTTFGCHLWSCIAGWENNDSSTRVWAPVFTSDRQCSDFAFDVDFPAPLGNQRVIFSCETQFPSDSGNWAKTPLFVMPILTRRTSSGSAPGSGYTRKNSQRPGSVGFFRDYQDSINVSAQWRDSGGAAGWRHCLIVTGRWDLDPYFNLRNKRPVPAFHDIDQAVAVGITIYDGPLALGTDYELSWGYANLNSGVWIPIGTTVSVSLPAGSASASVTVPAPASLPATAGMRYTIISRRKVAPSASFDTWDVLYSSKNIGGASNYSDGSMCLPRVYVYDVRKQFLLPSSADAVPVSHYGWTVGEHVLRPNAQPTSVGSWTLAYVPGGVQPWQVSAVVTNISGITTYGDSWAWAAGYRWRVQFPIWENGKPYTADTHIQAGATAGAEIWWKPDASITSAEYVLHRIAKSKVYVGDDSYQQVPFAEVVPPAYLWATYEWRQSISV